jgi:hypothetical protein
MVAAAADRRPGEDRRPDSLAIVPASIGLAMPLSLETATCQTPSMSSSPTFDTDPVRLAEPFPADFGWGFATSGYQVEGAEPR